jgi:hypothetical protein
MIWLVKKFIAHQTLEGGGDWVKFLTRMESEYQQEGMKVFEGLFRKKILYNKSFLLKRYLGLKERELDLLVEKRVQEPIGEVLAV